jgi:hypothetical protein
MHPLTDDDSLSVRDAAARLQYATGVRERTRRATLAPSLALVVLGGVVLAHGLLRTLWPHTAVVSIVLVAGIVAIRPLVRWLIARSEQRRGLHGSLRLRLTCGAAGAVGVAVAVGVGANPLISAIAAATAVAAYLAGLPVLSAAAVAAGLIGDMMIAHGVSPSVGELIIGAGLIMLGTSAHARERQLP